MTATLQQVEATPQEVETSLVLPVTLIALAPMVLVLLSTRHGIGTSYDSVAYASTARIHHATGQWAFSPLWPPGLPALIVFVGTGHGAIALNCAAAAANTIVAYLLAVAVTDSRRMALVVEAVVGLSLPLLWINSMLWSEPLFCVAVNLTLLALVRLQRSDRLWGPWLAVVVLSSNVACLLRFAAIPLLIVIGLVVVTTSNRTFPRAVMTALAVSCACGVSLLAIVVHNVQLGQAPTGPRLPSDYSLGDVVTQIPRIVSMFVLNQGIIVTGVGYIATVCLALLLVGWGRTLSRLRFRPSFVVASWVFLGFDFVIVSELVTKVDQLNFRLLAPLQVSFVILVVTAVRDLVPAERRNQMQRAVVVYVVFLGITSAAWASFSGPGDYYARYQDRSWDRVAASVAAHVPAGSPIVSNLPSLLVQLTGRNLVVGFPDAGPRPANRPFYIPGDITPYVRPSDYIVWLGDKEGAASGWREVTAGKDFVIYSGR